MSVIAVLGATGGTGRRVVDGALSRGHRVTAVVRRDGILAPAPGLTVVIAAPTDRKSMAALLRGHDAVISALGAAGTTPTTLYSDTAAALVDAVPAGGRVVVLSSAGVATPVGANLVIRSFALVLQRIMRNIYRDMLEMERRLAQSELRWTAVRPTALDDRPAGGHPRMSVGAQTRVGSRTSRADLADYLLDVVDDPATYGTVVAFSS